jgi:hypothetical protein
MKKVLLVIALSCFIASCATTKVPIVTTDIVNRDIPVFVVPAPPVVPHAPDATGSLTPAQKLDAGELVKAYAGDRAGLGAEVKLLRAIVDEYNSLAVQSGGGYEIVIIDGKPVIRKKADPLPAALAPPAPKKALNPPVK